MTIAVFLLVAAGTSLLLLRASTWRSRAIDRLGGKPELVAPVLPSPALVWRELVDRIGSAVPPSSKEQTLLRKRLIRAAFRQPEAVRLFRGIRAVSTVVLAACGLFF